MDFINVNCDDDRPILNIRVLNGALRGILKEETLKQNSLNRKKNSSRSILAPRALCANAFALRVNRETKQ